VIWTVLYISDYYLTIYAARLYQSGAKDHFSFEGSIEITPYYQEDVNALRRISPRFILMLIMSFGLILLLWLATVKFYSTPGLFSFGIGALILREAVVHIRHARNIFLFREACHSSGIEGRITYPRWLTLKASALELLSFAFLFLGLSLIGGSWFFIGGAFSCLGTSIRHFQYSKKARINEKPKVNSGDFNPESGADDTH
jgi:hypothetical protein